MMSKHRKLTEFWKKKAESKMHTKETRGLNLKLTQKKAAWLHEQGRFARLLTVFIVALTLPISNAIVERGFSLMSWIKINRRKKMLQDLLFAYMLLGQYKKFKFDFNKLVACCTSCEDLEI